MYMKKIFQWALAAALICGISFAAASCSKDDDGNDDIVPPVEEPDNGANSGREDGVVDLSKVTSDITLQDGDVVMGTLEGNHQVLIADNATVWLAGVTINSTEYSAIRCLGSATIILEDGTTNTLTTNKMDMSGIKTGTMAGDGHTTLTIRGNTGSLTAIASGYYGSGIGGTGTNVYRCTNITIEGGIINAKGGLFSAGIGTDYWTKDTGHGSGTITISGGTVTATGGTYAPGIGSGAQGICGDVVITSGVTSVTTNGIWTKDGSASTNGRVLLDGVVVYDGTTWSPDPMVSGQYGHLWLDISGSTWTLTPYQGRFTVNGDGKKVIFSPGLLQYNAGESYKWRFAPNQWDRSKSNGASGTWFNHFGWGTWTGGSPNPPAQILNNPRDYKWDGGDFAKEQELADASQRGYEWYTLSKDEWQYLFAHHTYGAASVHGVNGVIVLPDGVTSATGFTSGMNGSWIRVSDGDWEAMEADGALFLPAAGMRDVMNIRDYDYYGYYWSSTRYDRYDAYGLLFDNGNLNAADYATNNAAMGRLVRLVRNAE